MSVNPQNLTEVMQAIQLFGNVFLGIQLPQSAQPQTDFGCWSVLPGPPTQETAPGSWGGHCVPLMQYATSVTSNRLVLRLITWGAPLYMTQNFLTMYADEAYAVLSPDWLSKLMKSPGGLDMNQLMADLSKL